MIDGQIRNALRGISGEYELIRLGGFGLMVIYGLGAVGFTVWNMMEGREFSLVEWGTAFAGGCALLTGGTAGGVALKDRHVASSKVIAQTGAVPTPAIDGARVPTGDPPPVDKPADEAAGLPESMR